MFYFINKIKKINIIEYIKYNFIKLFYLKNHFVSNFDNFIKKEKINFYFFIVNLKKLKEIELKFPLYYIYNYFTINYSIIMFTKTIVIYKYTFIFFIHIFIKIIITYSKIYIRIIMSQFNIIIYCLFIIIFYMLYN